MSEKPQVVVFSAGDEKYAIDIDRVERIIEYSESTPLPETSDYVLGLITYQENILPVIDLNQRFYRVKSTKGDDSKILVVSLEEYKIGLLVDTVTEINSIESEMIEKPLGLVRGISSNYIKGLIKKEGSIIIYLDVVEIFKGRAEKELQEITK